MNANSRFNKLRRFLGLRPHLDSEVWIAEGDAPLWLSLGENCLSDDILKRHGKRSFSTPYSSCRTNIDYALTLEKTGYQGLLDPENLVASDAWGTPVVRSTLITRADNIFDPSCSKGFEFTHHNPINSTVDLESQLRKIARLLQVRRTRDVVFLYFHRVTQNSDIDLLHQKLRAFAGLYESDAARCQIVLFYQNIVQNPADRRLDWTRVDRTLSSGVFHTLERWGGKNPEVFWARSDDDLFETLFKAFEADIEMHWRTVKDAGV